MAWSGSFFILSLVLHIVIIGGAAVLVVQVVQARKEKMKFTAPPPAPPSAEHKVKPSKKTAAAAPAVTKRITSTAANASIALPTMDMNSSSPDMMSSVMSGMGASGLGSGAAGAGMASMSLSGLTAFGFKGGGAGIKGYFYDLKQTPGRMPTGIKPGDDVGHLKVITDFVDAGWDDAVLDKFYKAKDPMNTLQVYIPAMPATEAPKAFGVENEVKPGAWVIHYKGTVIAPRDGKFFFVGFADDLIMVRFDGKNVMAAGTMGHTPDSVLRDKYKTDNEFIKPIDGVGAVRYGKTFDVKGGKAYPIDILISEMPGQSFRATLAIGEDKPETPYRKSKLAGRQHPPLAYPLFQMKKGIPLPEWKDGAFEVDPKPTVFQAR
jgi:hypothetical protein